MMWSLKCSFDRRAYGPENLWSSMQKDFCNSIGTKRTCQDSTAMSAVRGMNGPGSDAARGLVVDPKETSIILPQAEGGGYFP
jgi:hypothetical protein